MLRCGLPLGHVLILDLMPGLPALDFQAPISCPFPGLSAAISASAMEQTTRVRVFFVKKTKQHQVGLWRRNLHMDGRQRLSERDGIWVDTGGDREDFSQW